LISEVRRPARLSDVAELAGVSEATASRVLNGSVGRQVKESNRRRVLAAAEKLGYTTNVAAQAIARGQNRGVTLLTRGVPDDYANPIVSGVVAAAERRGQIITMISAGSKADDLLRAVQTARANRPQVLIIAGGRREGDRTIPALVEALQLYELEGGRVVLISQSGLPFDTVAYENHDGAADMATTLVDLGYQRFAVLAGFPDGLTQQARRDGFLDGLASRGITVPPDLVITSEFSRDAAYAMTGELIRRGVSLDVIFAVNDAMALGALAFLRDAGQSAAGVAVAGFDDIRALRDISPSLTTVHLPWNEVAEQAIDLALDEERTGPRTRLVAGHVVVRESTPPRTESAVNGRPAEPVGASDRTSNL
jgi:LacI family transcriptional regulator